MWCGEWMVAFLPHGQSLRRFCQDSMEFKNLVKVNLAFCRYFAIGVVAAVQFRFTHFQEGTVPL